MDDVSGEHVVPSWQALSIILEGEEIRNSFKVWAIGLDEVP